jgi:Polysaccharide deacetylase
VNRVPILNALGRLPPFALKWLWPARFVLYGHLVSDRKGCMAAQRYRYPDFAEFERFRALAEQLGYRFVTLEQYVSGAFPRMILLTFDDGFHEVAEFYRLTGLPFVLFIVSEALENEAFGLDVFAPGHGAFLSRADILQLKQSGVHIGFHTRTHKRIRALADLEHESSPPPQCADLLSEPACFAYPFEGPADYRPVSAALVAAGYTWVFDTKFRTGADGRHIFRIPMDRAHADAVDNAIIANVLQARLAELKRAWRWR